jgi:hypothetical protein
VTVLDVGTLQQIPGVNLDDRLRIIPGFSLFRRSSSVVAHPTTQGVSLRGIASSGASRTVGPRMPVSATGATTLSCPRPCHRQS